MESGEGQNLQGVRVALFAEEGRHLRHYLSILRLCGLREIAFSEEIPDAIQEILAGNIQLIFVVHLGEALEATRFIREVRGIEGASAIPIVAITDEDGVRDALRIYAKGVAKILKEPLSRRTLEDLMREISGGACEPDRLTQKVEMASRMVKRGDIERARGIYEDLLLEGCTSLDVYLGLAAIHTEKGEWLEGEGTLKRAMDLARKLPDRLESSLGLSLVFYHYGRFYDRRQLMDKALKSYRTCVSLNPYYLQGTLALMDILQRCGELVEILTVVRGVRERYPAFSQPLSEVAQCLDEIAKKFERLGMYAQARDICRELLSLPHAEVAIHIRAAAFLAEHGRISFVIKRLAEISGKLKSARICELLGGILLDTVTRHVSRGRWAKSAEQVDLGILQDIDPSEVVRMALGYIQQGLLLDPELLGLKLHLARCRMKLGERETAMELIDNVRAAQSGDAEFLAYGAGRLVEDRSYDAAFAWLLDGMSRYPRDHRLFLLCAECLRAQGKPQDSARCLKRGLAVQPDNVEMLTALAETCIELNSFAEAVTLFQRAQRIRPNDERIRTGLETAQDLRVQMEKGRGR